MYVWDVERQELVVARILDEALDAVGGAATCVEPFAVGIPVVGPAVWNLFDGIVSRAPEREVGWGKQLPVVELTFPIDWDV